jgi:hypothetical protein
MLREYVFYSSRDGERLNVSLRGLLNTGSQAGQVGDVLTPVPPILIDKELPSSGHLQSIADESTSPTGLGFAGGITSTSGPFIASLAPNQEFGIWLQRQIPAGMTPFPAHLVSLGYQFTANGITYQETCNGMFRIANTAVQGYELSMGVNRLPDFTAAPVETFSSLPHTTTLTLEPNTTYYAVTNFRNRFGLVSQSTDATIIPINGSGEESSVPPSAPVKQAITATASGAFEITALYYFLQDPTAKDDNGKIVSTSTSFHLFVSFDGSDPLLQMPISVPFRNVGGVMLLDYTTDAQDIGTTAKAVVRVYRSSDSSESTNSTVIEATSIETAFGPASLGVFWPQVAQAQS